MKQILSVAGNLASFSLPGLILHNYFQGKSRRSNFVWPIGILLDVDVVQDDVSCCHRVEIWECANKRRATRDELHEQGKYVHNLTDTPEWRQQARDTSRTLGFTIC